mgnify:CR=1 FL=1
MLDVTVVLPIHGERLTNGMGEKAIKSVLTQEMPPNALIIEVDKERLGAAEVRHRGLMKVTTEFVAFLDSDDSFYPNHLKALSEAIEAEDADFAFSHPIAWGAPSPFEADFGKPWDNDNPRHTTVVTMVRTSIAQQVGFLKYNRRYGGEYVVSHEDWEFMMGCREAGAKIIHVPEKTWFWNLHGRNSAGVPGQGDAPPRV